MIFFAQQSCSFYFCLPEHLISFPLTDLPAVTPVNCVNKGIFVGLGQNFRSLQWQFTQLREFSNNMFCQWLQRPCFTIGFFFLLLFSNEQCPKIHTTSIPQTWSWAFSNLLPCFTCPVSNGIFKIRFSEAVKELVPMVFGMSGIPRLEEARLPTASLQCFS